MKTRQTKTDTKVPRKRPRVILVRIRFSVEALAALDKCTEAVRAARGGKRVPREAVVRALASCGCAREEAATIAAMVEADGVKRGRVRGDRKAA